MATPVLACGWECGQISASASPALGQHWTDALNATISTTTVRSGSRSLRFNPAAAVAGVNSPVLASSLVWVGRVYVYFATLPDNTRNLAVFPLGTGPSVAFRSTDSTICAGIGLASLTLPGVAVTTGIWYRIDFKFEINTTGNDTSTVSVDGVSAGVASGTGLSAAQTTIRMGGQSAYTGDVFYDDLILSHTAADYPLGAGYVNHFVPTSDGTHNIAGTGDFLRTLTGTDILNATTTAYQLVDDVPLESGASVDWINMAAPTAATQYVECIFGPAPGISTPTTAPRAVEAIAGIHQSAAGTTGNMEIRLNDNGTMGTVYTATAVAGVTAVAYKRAHFADPPTANSNIDSYSESNADTEFGIGFLDTYTAVGQSFTATAATLGSAVFLLSKTTSPTGPMMAKLYASTGTHGSTAVPTGSALATSASIDASTLTGVNTLTTFTFSGSNAITLSNGVVYIIVLECLTATASNRVWVRLDSSSPSHAGNHVRYSGSWAAEPSWDTVFYVKTVSDWTVAGSSSNFNALRVRFGSPAVLDVAPDQYFDCIMLEAEFAEVSAAPVAKIYSSPQAVPRASLW